MASKCLLCWFLNFIYVSTTDSAVDTDTVLDTRILDICLACDIFPMPKLKIKILFFTFAFN